jgi:hypothetical protein
MPFQKEILHRFNSLLFSEIDVIALAMELSLAHQYDPVLY